MKIFTRSATTETLTERIKRHFVTFIKVVVLLLKPAVVATLVAGAWYLLLYRHDINFGAGEPTTGILLGGGGLLFVVYGALLSTPVMEIPCGQLVTMRLARKREDIDTFMDLADEDIPTAMHVIVGLPAFGCILCLAGIKYPTAHLGGTLISVVIFVFVLMYYLAREIDDPRSGLWCIEDLTGRWAQDPKEYRKERAERLAHGTPAAESEKPVAPLPPPPHATQPAEVIMA